MTTYEVEITNEALADMEELHDYIALELLSPENAMGQYNRIADKILTLDNFPERHGIMDKEPGHSRGTRIMPVDNYSIFYVVVGEKVYVTDVLYSASDIIARLKDVKLF